MNGFTSNNKAVPLYCIFHNHNHIGVATRTTGDYNPPVKDQDSLIEQLVTESNHRYYILCTICNSYTMARRDLPDIYSLAQGPQTQGRGHIYQANLD